MRNRAAMLIWCLLAGLLASCGGSGTPLATGKGALGTATFTMVWPARTRLIPVTANSIVVQIGQGATVLARQVLSRPASGGNATATFNALPTGNFKVTATAYPQADGSGTAQAAASIPLTIQANSNTAFSLTMASTIQQLTVSAPYPNIEAGLSETLTATALDAAGNVVLTAPGNIQWNSSDTSVATVDAAGKVTTVNGGSVQITATEVESGRKGAVTVTVSPAGTLLRPYA